MWTTSSHCTVLGKTEYVLFGSKSKLKKSSNFSFQCVSHSIPAQESVKYRGIEIDQHVSGEKIAKCVLRKANARIKFLYRQGKYLKFNCLKPLCSALIQCLFDYASCSWFSGLSSNFKNKLQTTQNKIVRFITNQGPWSHVGQHERSQTGYLSVEDRVKFLRLCHTYKIFSSQMYQTDLAKFSMPESKSPVLLDYLNLLWLL